MIITDDHIKNVSLSTSMQYVCVLSLALIISWISFLSGKYFTHQEILKQKEFEVQQVNLINLDLQTKVDNLQGNLVRLNDYFDKVKDFDYNQTSGDIKEFSVQKLNNKITEQEDLSSLQEMQQLSYSAKEKIEEDINQNTLLRIADLKNIISLTGLSVSDVNIKSAINLDSNLNEIFDFENQGGPFTENIDNIEYNNNAIDAGFNFAEKIEELLYLEKFLNSVPVVSPIKKYYISSRYGRRIDPRTRKLAFHYGTDFVGSYGAKVYSTAPGVVKFAGRKGNYGNLVEIDHGHNIVTRYGHLRDVTVKKGELISRKHLIGHQGNTGRSTGQHLHYEIRYNNQPYNPEKFLKAGQYVF